MATPKLTPFELRGADGGPLRGDLRVAHGGGERPAVVICHGFKGFKDWGFFPRLAERLATAGFAAVSFNFSGSGVGPDGERFSEPERFGHATFSGDLADLGSVVGALRDGNLVAGMAPPTRLGLFGHSRGGGTAILFSAADGDVSAVVTWAAIAKPLRWGSETVKQWREQGKLDIRNMRTGEVLPLYTDLLDELEADTTGRWNPVLSAAQVRAPWLVAHGEVDEAVSVNEGVDLARAAPGSQLLRVPRAGHTFGARHPWAGSTPELDKVMDATVAWFVRHLFD